MYCKYSVCTFSFEYKKYHSLQYIFVFNENEQGMPFIIISYFYVVQLSLICYTNRIFLMESDEINCNKILKPNPVISEWGGNGPKINLHHAWTIDLLALNYFQRLDSHGGNLFSNADTIITLLFSEKTLILNSDCISIPILPLFKLHLHSPICCVISYIF